MKRLFDIVVSAVAMLLLSPLFVLLSLLIFLTMGLPILFVQERPGRSGRVFRLMKFRTMRLGSASTVDPETDSGRLTPLGSIMRLASLDELPELWNVLRGDMSLVGPRPLLVEYLPLYSKEQVRRHEVRPGITGWAQINGRNARLLHDAVTSGGSFRSPWPSERIDHAWYRYHCFAENREERDRILEQMHEAGVPCFQGPCPEIYREQAFADAGFVPADRLPVARHLGETSLQFLTYHTIDEASMHQAANRVAEVLERV